MMLRGEDPAELGGTRGLLRGEDPAELGGDPRIEERVKELRGCRESEGSQKN